MKFTDYALLFLFFLTYVGGLVVYCLVFGSPVSGRRKNG